MIYRWLESLFGIRRGEIVRSLLMFLYGFLLLSAYLILKPVRNSLFLTKFGPEQLVFMYMIIAVVAGLVAVIYGMFARRLSLLYLIAGSTGFIIMNLAGFWWLIRAGTSWLVYVFYVWVSIFGVVTTSQFWLLGNHLFDAREAKRLFPFIGAGAIAGGLAGSKITNLFAALVGTEDLLLICMGLMAAILALLFILWPMRQRVARPRRRGPQGGELTGLRSILGSSRHLQLLAGIIAVTVMVSTFIDFQFNTVIARTFTGKDQLTAFLGDFFFYLSLASLGLQFMFSSRILRRFGVGTAIAILPVSLLVGSATLFLWPVLGSAVALKMADGGLRYSVNKAGNELLFMPVPAVIKNRVKALMDVLGDRFARGIGGALLFVIQYMLEWPVERVALLSGGLIVVWIVLVFLIRREYSSTFRSALELRSLDSEEVRVQLRDAGSIADLISALGRSDERHIRFVLKLTSEIDDARLHDALRALLTHTSADIRQEALTQLVRSADASIIADVHPLVTDVDPGVRNEALGFLARHDPEDARRQLRELLTHEDPTLTASAIRSALEHRASLWRDGLDLRAPIEQALAASPHPGADEARRIVADSLRFLTPEDPLVRHLDALLADEQVEVVRSALRSAGRLCRRDHLSVIIPLLAKHRLRNAATETLVAYGPRILGTLRDHLVDPQVDIRVRRTIPRIIGAIGTQEAVPLLCAHLDTGDHLLRYRIIKALNRLRRQDGRVRFDRSEILQLLTEEIRTCYRYALWRQSLATGPDSSAANRLLGRAIEERRQRCLDQSFRFAGLIYSQDDMRFAFSALTRGAAPLRASAIEFLDTIWDRRLKERMFPILETDLAGLPSAARRAFGLEVPNRRQTLEELLDGSDPWLAACSVYAVHQERITDLRSKLDRLRTSPSAALRTAAEAALEDL